jgi:cold shock CspA family protein
MTAARREPRAPRRGTVTEFDEARGLGEISDRDGVRFPFHCTAIADSSRQIAIGASVVFRLAPGHRGRYEARDIETLGPG